MFHSDIKLKEGAFFLSDVHYSYLRPHFLDFLKAVHTKKLFPTQLIFMGDIFDMLFGGINKVIERNSEAISLINTISQDIEVIYLEGNHDFNLKNVFPQAIVFSIKQQPVVCKYNDKVCLLAHGDFDGSFWYRFYTSIVRNRFVLRFLNLFDSFIINKLDSYLSLKDDCKKLDWFEGFIQKRIGNNYSCEYFIEGHFHQNKSYSLDKINYINLGAFACNQRYFVVKSSKDKELLEENIFSKET